MGTQPTDLSKPPRTTMDDPDRYRPSEDAKAFAAATMPPPGAPPAQPLRRSKHVRTASFSGISATQLSHLTLRTPQEARDNILAWRVEVDEAGSRGPNQDKRGSALTTPALDDVTPAECISSFPETATTDEDDFPPLPKPSQEEEMDTTSSRKRRRPEDSSDDEENARRKLAPAAPSSESDTSNDSTDSTLSSESNSTQDSSATSDSSVANTTTTTRAGSVNQVNPTTVPTSPPGTPAAEVPQETAMEETEGAPAIATTPPNPAAAFLKDAPRAPTTGNPRRKRKRNRNRRKTRTVPASQRAAVSSLTSGNQRTQPTGSATTRGTPPSLHLAPGNAALPASQTVDEEGFQTVRSRAALRRTRDLTTAALPVDPTVVGTVLYRPAAAGGSFRSCPRLTLAQALSSHPGVSAIRVNHHRNVVAADATSQDCLEQLLTLTELQGIPVTARLPADRRTSTGFLHGVDGDPDAESLLSSLQSAVRVLSATREGRTVTLRFEGPVPPDHVTLHRVRFPVRPARPRPLQCRQCGRYGHVKETCSWPGSCIRCGQTHPDETDCQRLRCVNCSGPHRADTPDCPRWQEQRRVATIMASSTSALSRRAVAAVVREETREARSYASAVKGHPAPVAPTPAPRNRRRPPPAVTAHTPAVPASRAAPAIQPAATVPPPAVGAPGVQSATTPAPAPTVEQLLGPLLLSLQAIAALLPTDHPLRAICLQAGAWQQTTNHHG